VAEPTPSPDPYSRVPLPLQHLIPGQRVKEGLSNRTTRRRLAYLDGACLAARMAQCFRDLGEAGHAGSPDL
jgi:hypothetical protein